MNEDLERFCARAHREFDKFNADWPSVNASLDECRATLARLRGELSNKSKPTRILAVEMTAAFRRSRPASKRIDFWAARLKQIRDSIEEWQRKISDADDRERLDKLVAVLDGIHLSEGKL